jgi:NitT/TauT family transport system substrate-binding protein
MRHTFGLLAAFVVAALGTAATAAPFKLIVTETTTPVVPNSVMDLAVGLGFYKKAGVDVELVRVQQTPSAVAALKSGSGDMANIGFDTALQLVARDQMKLKGVISPDKALPFVIAAKKELKTVKSLEGHSFGVGRVGSLDYNLSRLVLAKLGADVDKIDYVALGQPAVRGQALAAGRVDATTMSIGVWESIPDKGKLGVLVNQAKYYASAPLISKINVVTAETAKTKAKEVEGVIKGIILASRDFAKHPEHWVDAMVKARPDVKRETLQFLAKAYKESWSANGGIDLAAAEYTTESLYKGKDFEGLRKVPVSEWIDTAFIDKVLKANGKEANIDMAGR